MKRTVESSAMRLISNLVNRRERAGRVSGAVKDPPIITDPVEGGGAVIVTLLLETKPKVGKWTHDFGDRAAGV